MGIGYIPEIRSLLTGIGYGYCLKTGVKQPKFTVNPHKIHARTTTRRGRVLGIFKYPLGAIKRVSGIGYIPDTQPFLTGIGYGYENGYTTLLGGPSS
eukprot:scaffold4314_cov117-Skeletonema_dohrnii-CCMP3373.AAC.1